MGKLKVNPNDQMTPWERKKAFECGKETDRVITVPFMSELKCLITGQSIDSWWHDAHIMADVEIQLFNKFGYDRLTLGPNTRGITEAFGDEVIYEEPFQTGKHPRIKPFLEALKRLTEEAECIVPVEASIGGPFTIASNLLGIERMLRDCRRQPEQIQEMMRMITDAQKSVIDEIAKCGQAGIAMADPVANPMLIGPKMYERFVFPYTKELTDYAYEKTGQKVSLHMCGKTDAIWKYLAQYQLNEVSLDNIVDLQKAAVELGQYVTIAGNVDPVGIILNGTKEEIFRDVQRCIETGKIAKCGFHLATGCDIPELTAPGKIEWFMEAARCSDNE